MEITLNTVIPDDTAANLQNGSSAPLPRRLLELATSKAHEFDLITEREVMEVLGFASREELYDFFKRYDVRGASYTAQDSAALEELLTLRHR